MDFKELLHETLYEFTTSSLEKLKWSVNISMHWIFSQLQNTDMYSVVELIQKSSADCVKMTIKILKDVPRLDLVHKLQAPTYFNPKTKDTWRPILETLRNLTCVEYNTFISRLESELSHIWKQRLDEADLSQVIQLMETLFSKDSAVLTKLVLEEMARLHLISKRTYLTSVTRDASVALSHLSHRKFEKLRHLLQYYLPHIPVSELEEANSQSIMVLMETNSHQNCIEMTEKVLKRMERPDLMHKLSQSEAFTENLLKTLKVLDSVELDIFKGNLKIYLPLIPKSQLQMAGCEELVELMDHNTYQNCVEIAKWVFEQMKRPDLVDKLLQAQVFKEDLLKTLWDLDSVELGIFKNKLKTYLPHIPKRQLQMADCEEVVELMEQNTHQNCVVIAKRVFEQMRRPDLVDKLSHHSSGVKGSIATKESIRKTLKHLGDTEFIAFKHNLKIYLPNISESELKQADFQTVVLLMRKNLHQACMKTTGKILQKIGRPDLGQKLLHRPSITHAHQFYVKMRKKTEAMESVIQLLLDTLDQLPDVSLQQFQKTLTDLLHLKRRTPPEEMDPEETVFWIVQQYGRQSVKKVADIFVNMGLSEVAQRLMFRSSETTDLWYFLGHFGDQFWKHQYLWLQMVVVLAMKDLLLDTAHELSYKQLSHLEWFVQFTCFQRGISWIDLESESQTQQFKIMATTFCPLTAKEACNAMISAVVLKHGRKSLDVMEDVFINMNRDGLETISGFRERGHFSQTKFGLNKVEEMVAVINLLTRTLEHLNVRELTDLKHALTTGPYSAILWCRLYHYEMSHLVIFIVQTYGQRSVEITKNLLGSIGRRDLQQRLFKDNSESNEDSPDVWWSGLIRKVATMAAVNEVFGETLKQLSCEELKQFKKLFLLKTIFHNPPHVDMSLMAIAKTEETGTLLLQTYGWKAVETTYWILMDMNRSDLAQKLQCTMNFPKGKPPEQRVAMVEDLREVLCKTLAGLSHVELAEFKWMLQLTCCEMGLEWIPQAVLEGEEDTDGLVDLIIETSGQLSMEVITDVLEHMNRSDLVTGYTDEDWSPDYTDAHVIIQVGSRLRMNLKVSTDLEKVLVVLQDLTDCKEMQVLQKFLKIICENNLSRRFVKNYIRMHSGLRDLVELLVAIHGESKSINIIQTVLTKMRRYDLVEKMPNPGLTSKALAERVELDSCTSAVDIWTKLEPEVQETDTDNQLTYRLQSDAGSYECSVSGLRWCCEEKVSFQYKFGSWEEHVEQVENMHYMPAGPLIDLTVSSGRLDVVYLPHWVCIDNPNTEDKLAVLHTDDCGDTVEKVTEVTSTHVKLLEPIFSPRAVLIKLGISVKIYCSVLIYKTNTAFLTLHVYLIPRDPGLKQSMDRSEQDHGYSIIRKPHPDKSLKMRDRFVLKTELETVEISPQKLRLRYQSPPNFFEVYSRNPDFDFKLELAEENELASVWSCTIRQADYTERAPAVPSQQGIHFVDKFQTQLIERVSNIAEIMDHLKEKGVVGSEAYDTIRKLPIAQEKMRELFSGPLKSSGDRGKDIFYRILKKKEPLLCADLEKS